ncbi:hypothetical protein NAT65_01425 [Achromobacter xylosoxidans]|uniref:hypothetical protein n=1 Tax=Alcaligenes xylosoxydans xylosoxydans TaxID=85698 RepID=UPI00203EDF8D|nr:hypothetical protein [Achromobacter xylosoxidans]MCM2569731.1 hypothetical protein [Achromobacter xylosoxidans]
MEKRPVVALGMSWYSRENYERVKALSDDPEVFPNTFDSWQKLAQAGFDKFTAQGHLVIKADINPETFPQWCRDNGHRVDAKGRIAFANARAAAALREMQTQ